jgi:phospholipid/cholesterol/gamma-HCH transport system substrate-binding protein
VKRFRERNRALTGAIGLAVVLGVTAAALNFSSLPLIHSEATYSADFVNAGGLAGSDIVTIDGVKVGSITGMSLEGDHVLVTFDVSPGIHLGSTTSAAAKVLSPIGTEYLELTPSGPGTLNAIIPESRTSVPYNLVTDLSGLGNTIEAYNLPALEKALAVGQQDLSATSTSELTKAFDGLARISSVVGGEQSALATIVTQGAQLAGVLSNRSNQLFNLFGQANLVLSVLEQREASIKTLLTATSSLSRQITSILAVNQTQLSGLLDSLQTVSAILAKDATDIDNAIPVLQAFSRYSANSTGSGAFADVSIPTLLIPDNVAVECGKKGSFPSKYAQVGCRP